VLERFIPSARPLAPQKSDYARSLETLLCEIAQVLIIWPPLRQQLVCFEPLESIKLLRTYLMHLAEIERWTLRELLRDRGNSAKDARGVMGSISRLRPLHK
jgi:hypothetical protein